MKMLSTCFRVFILWVFAGVICLQAKETLVHQFAGSGEIQAGTKNVSVDGKVSDGYLKFGADGVQVPASELVTSETGTVMVTFKVDEFKENLTVPRFLMTLRTAGRPSARLSIHPSQKKLNFIFGEHKKMLVFQAEEKISPGQDYTAAISWDGNTVRMYLNGLMVMEGKQPVALAPIRNLYFGPFKDGWYATKPWNDDCYVKEVRTFDTVISPEEIAGLGGVEFKPLAKAFPFRLSVPEASAAPVIDGELGDGAWKFSASMPRLIRGNFPVKSGELPPHKFLMTYDRENLYLGFDTVFPAGVTIVTGEKRTDGVEREVWGQESFEFYLTIGERRYRFGGNVAGGYVEGVNGKAEWNGKWTYRTTLKMQIDDTLLWQGEVAIPWATLELSAPPVEPVKMNFCRTWRLPDIGAFSSLNVEGAQYNENNIEAVFVKSTPVLQVVEQNDPNSGEYLQKFSIGSSLNSKVNYDISLGRLDGSRNLLPIFNRNFQVKANDIYTDSINLPINNTGYDCLVYTLTGNNQLSMREIVPFKLNEEYFSLTPLFLSDKIIVKIREAILLSKMGNNFKGNIVLKDPNGKVLFDKPFSSTAEIPFKREYPSGVYVVELVNTADKSTVFQREVNYPGIGEWEKMTFDNRIIPPFTPLISNSGNNSLKTEMWGRTYSWNNSLFPDTIKSQGTELLFAPIALVINGKNVPRAEVKVNSTAQHRTEFTAVVKNNDYEIIENSWVEYDGVNYNKLRLKANSSLQGIKLKVELPAALGKYLHTSNGGGAWFHKITDTVKTGEKHISYFPVLWLGMEDKGLCLFFESRKNWKSATQQAFKLTKNDRTVVWEVNLADQLKAGEVFDFEFGILASPVRPLPRNYPLNTLSWSHAARLNRPGQPPVSDIDFLTGIPKGDLGSFFADLPTPDGKKTADSFRIGSEKAIANGARPIPYTCAMMISDKYPEMAAFKEDWAIKPERAMDYDKTNHFIYNCCPATSASTFFNYKFKKMLETFNLKGIYFDFGLIGNCNNQYHGCDQRIPILGMREFYRRIALVQLEAGIKDPVTVAHNTDSILLPGLTFATHLLNGEQVRQASSTILHDRRDVLDTYDITIFASELNTLPFGITNSVYMPFDNLREQFGGNEKDAPYKFRMTKAAMAATLIHNTMPCVWRMHFGIFDKLIRAYHKFDVPSAEFIGYWNQPARVTKGNGIYVSAYRHKEQNKLLAVIGHVDKAHQDQEIEIVFDTGKLGLKTLNKAIDVMTADDPDYAELESRRKQYKIHLTRTPLELGDFGSKVISIKDNVLKMNLKHHSFAIIELAE